MSNVWREIEIQFKNSQILEFIDVKVDDQLLEKRGDGRRMVFHCQGLINFINWFG